MYSLFEVWKDCDNQNTKVAIWFFICASCCKQRLERYSGFNCHGCPNWLNSKNFLWTSIPWRVAVLSLSLSTSKTKYKLSIMPRISDQIVASQLFSQLSTYILPKEQNKTFSYCTVILKIKKLFSKLLQNMSFTSHTADDCSTSLHS